jgi:hypothetical protein
MRFSRVFILIPLIFAQSLALAAEANFSGTWTIDLRTAEEKKANTECGSAEFKLFQTAEKITGQHTFATPRCSRVNEGGPKSVAGTVIGSTAVLVVTSGRNGAMVLGKATLKGSTLHWQTLQELKPGDPEGDSPLILGNGVLTRAANN